MIDIHCHVIPGVDDGAQDMEKSIDMCKYFKEIGVNTVVATPHFIKDTQYILGPTDVLDKVEEVKKAIAQEGIDLKIYPGMELFITPDLPEILNAKEALTLNNTRYVLVELPANEVPIYTEDVFDRLIVNGFIPILAHPERYSKFLSNRKLLKKLVEKGVLLQVNEGSFRKKYGRLAKEVAINLLTSGMAHFIATDTHKRSARFKGIKALEKELTGLIGAENTKKLMYTNPERLINDETIENLEPVITARGVLYNTRIFIKRNILQRIAKMRKRTKVITVVLAIMVFLTVGSLYAVNKVFDMMVESMLTGDLLDDEIVVTDNDKQKDNQQNTIEQDDNEKTPGSGSNTSGKVSENDYTGNNNTPTGDVLSNGAKTGNTKDNNKGTKGTQSTSVPSNANNGQGAVPVKKIKEIEDKVTITDKTKAVSIISSSLSASDISEISSLVKGGVTKEEQARIKEIMRKALSSEDKDAIKKLFYKYNYLLED